MPDVRMNKNKVKKKKKLTLFFSAYFPPHLHPSFSATMLLFFNIKQFETFETRIETLCFNFVSFFCLNVSNVSLVSIISILWGSVGENMCYIPY